MTKRDWDIPPLEHPPPTAPPEPVERRITGPVHNHTRRLSKKQVIALIEQWAELALSKEERVTLVHVADADEPTILTAAVRDWRGAEGRREEFTQDVGGHLYWFGVRYTSPGD